MANDASRLDVATFGFGEQSARLPCGHAGRDGCEHSERSGRVLSELVSTGEPVSFASLRLDGPNYWHIALIDSATHVFRSFSQVTAAFGGRDSSCTLRSFAYGSSLRVRSREPG